MSQALDNISSNNTNKLSPQEHSFKPIVELCCSNNTNKLSPQEQKDVIKESKKVQIIQINLVLKNIILTTSVMIAFK